MKQRGIVRLAAVLGLVLGVAWALLERVDPATPFLVQFVVNCLMNAVLIFVILWIVLTGLAWAIRGLRKAT